MAGVPHGTKVTILEHQGIRACAGSSLDSVRYKVGVCPCAINDPFRSNGSSPQVGVYRAHSRLVKWDPVQVVNDDPFSNRLLLPSPSVGQSCAGLNGLLGWQDDVISGHDHGQVTWGQQG